jgi:hypothetical protein
MSGATMSSLVQGIARRRPSLASVVAVVFAVAIIVVATTMTFELMQLELSDQGTRDARDAS